MKTDELPAPESTSSLVDRWDTAFENAFPTEGAPVATPPIEEAPAEEGKKTKPTKAPTLDDFINLEETSEVEEEEIEEEIEEEEEEIPDDDEVPDEVAKQGDKAVETWKTLKTDKKTLSQKVKALEAELANAKKAPATPTKELAEMQKRLAEQEQVISAISVKESKEYHEAVVAPLTSIETKARSLTTDEEHEELIIEALGETDPKVRIRKISEASEGMSDFAKNEFYALVRNIDKVFAKQQDILARSVEARKELDAKKLAEQGRETQQQKDARLAATEKVWGNVVKKMPWMLDETGEVKPEYVKIKDGIGDGLSANSPVGTMVFASFAAHLVPEMAAVISTKDSEIATLKKSIAALKGAAPRKGGGGTPAPTPSKSNGNSFMDRLDNAFAEGKIK